MKDKIIELLKQYEDTHTQGVYRCDYDELADEVVKLFCQPAVISSLPSECQNGRENSDYCMERGKCKKCL